MVACGICELNALALEVHSTLLHLKKRHSFTFLFNDCPLYGRFLDLALTGPDDLSVFHTGAHRSH